MNMKKINITSMNLKFPIRFSYIYLAVPMYIFLFGWLKLYIAIIAAVILTCGIVPAWKDAPGITVSRFDKSSVIKIIGIALIAFIWVYLSGIGGFAYQNSDFIWRNAILEKLVSEKWPVIISNTNPYFEKPAAMIYYFALWLPAAAAGKLWGMKAAQIILYLWCTAGILLVFSLLLFINKRISVVLIISFIFFSGADAAGDFILNNSTGYLWFTDNHIENWAYGFQMSSLCTQLFWVFNQAIPAWIITLLLLCQKNNRSVLFIFSFSFLSCTLPAIGMIPVLLCTVIHRAAELTDKTKKAAQNIKYIFKDLFTFQNLCTGSVLLIISGTFLISNTTTENHFRINEMKNLFMSYLIFILLEFLIYYFAIYKHQKRNPMYWTSLASLLTVPIISFGPHIDFVMRASIPALIVLFVLTAETLKIYCMQKCRFRAAVLAILLSLGAITPYHEIVRSIRMTIKHEREPDIRINETGTDLFENGYRNNFFGEYGDSVFFEYFSKK